MLSAVCPLWIGIGFQCRCQYSWPSAAMSTCEHVNWQLFSIQPYRGGRAGSRKPISRKHHKRTSTWCLMFSLGGSWWRASLRRLLCQGGMPNTEGPPDGKARAKRKLPQPINVNMRMTSKAEGQCAGWAVPGWVERGGSIILNLQRHIYIFIYLFIYDMIWIYRDTHTYIYMYIYSINMYGYLYICLHI